MTSPTLRSAGLAAATIALAASLSSQAPPLPVVA